MSAVDALHLEAHADVDAGRTDGDTAVAINAVTNLAFLVFAKDAAGLTAIVVITNDGGMIVEQYGLESTVGTGDEAELFAEPCKIKKEKQVEKSHEGEPTPVIARVMKGHGNDVAGSYKIAKDGIGKMG